ncbi:YbcC family protein [Methylocystis rosea]|uniref:YbcC family protein n=1 Tax=Methylocystis rosea TaxID=173366 RepID=UPI000379EFB2|nr:DUF2309 domain-containing protein [Methylocystis rosea]
MFQLKSELKDTITDTASLDLAPEEFPRFSDSPARRKLLQVAIDRACHKIAPLWPLKHFVAVNPFLGFANQSFASTAATLKRVAKTRMLMPRGFYRQAIEAGAISDADLEAALARSSNTTDGPADVAALKEAAASAAKADAPNHAAIATVAEVLDALADGDRQASLVGFMIDDISRWCAAYFDDGQASWRMPNRDMKPYAAWRAAARYDRNPEAMGVRGFRRAIVALPDDPVETIGAVIEKLGIADRAIDDYLHRTLFDIGGWAAYARYLVWNSELYGEPNDTLTQLLAIRVAYGYGLFQSRSDAAFSSAWSEAMRIAAAKPQDECLNNDADLTIDLILQDAYEIAFQRRLVARLHENMKRTKRREKERAVLQAAFCIDVRSEIYRRALETVCPQVETIGFAGFFGFPIEYVPIGHSKGGAQCPVLLRPAFIVCEAVGEASEEEKEEVLGLRLLRRRASKAWKAFKLSAVSSFAFVESAAFLYAGKILSDSLGLTRVAPHPNLDGLDRAVIERVGPSVEPRIVGGRNTGFTESQRVAMAVAVLKAMSMTENFARLVMLAGHGSTTVNNPHATGLDCGACGGHTGEANARVAATILNDAHVREGLALKGIHIPHDTWFLGALHDTTTDEVRLYDVEKAPRSHTKDISELKAWLAKASSLARMERSVILGLAGQEGIDAKIVARSRDWSQVRPEWGLAGNAAFIAARRERTRGLDLGGRAFLHSYDHTKDDGYSVLELIMTAPMVVASWINLQYFGSTVNNRVFGSGNKTLHNVVGQIGVLEGNAGDLKVGLPWQSVHDGKRFIHEPLRLNVFIEAPEAAIEEIIRKNDTVRDLVNNRWLHLYCFDDVGDTIRSYHTFGDWRAVADDTTNSV